MNSWLTLCSIEDILPGSGLCALVDDRQIALFRPHDQQQVFALSNIDPFAQASVLSRGIIGEHQGELWVASPLKKQHFRLQDGLCMEDESRSIASYQVRVDQGKVQINTAQLAAQ
ncbi:nitrite reductase small subunit NirD [Rahnella sp. SAP-1]|uniref:Nitrite reductase (NADH) small subunit n=1 Tax=Rouxiella aceris TaxID=2703884 RepID=A0A848MNM2_9GAMM|nr:nitrite reductase small subunit NirD [Rouxiella aceris]NMP28472.1 nitrite reductase small subunit NirD [Rouxiella aceris]